jgi:hypothetical protein
MTLIGEDLDAEGRAVEQDGVLSSVQQCHRKSSSSPGRRNAV